MDIANAVRRSSEEETLERRLRLLYRHRAVVGNPDDDLAATIDKFIKCHEDALVAETSAELKQRLLASD